MNQILKSLQQIPKSTFSIEDLSKISPLSGQSLRVAIHRMIKKGDLISLSRGLYCLPDKVIDSESIACEYGYPAYISLESALAIRGLLHQIPHSIELVTLGRSRSIGIGNTAVNYHHIQKHLFWGYHQEGSIWISEPEKAIIDLIYFERRGIKRLAEDEIRWDGVDPKKMEGYAKKIGKGYIIERVREIVDR